MHSNKIAGKEKNHLSNSFQEILRNELGKSTLTISHHASQRMKMRGIEMSPELMNRLEGAVDKASVKGAKDTLVILDNLAFVVSVKNRTVITAIDEDSLKNNLFTNIDSAIIN